jgi:hypothetical protein
MEDTLIPLFFIFWAFAYLLDALSTIRYGKGTRYEKNRLFAYIADKLGISAGITVHLLIELVFISFIPFIFLRTLSIEASAVTACLTGLLHIDAFISNIRFRYYMR